MLGHGCNATSEKTADEDLKPQDVIFVMLASNWGKDKWRNIKENLVQNLFCKLYLPRL